LPAAERDFRKALELNPNSALAHRELAFVYRQRGQYRRDSTEQAAARALDPLSQSVLSQQGWPELYGRRYPEAERAFRDVLRQNPNLDEAHCGLGLTLLQLERPAEAIDEFTEAFRVGHSPSYLAFLAHADAIAGARSRARAL